MGAETIQDADGVQHAPAHHESQPRFRRGGKCEMAFKCDCEQGIKNDVATITALQRD